MPTENVNHSRLTTAGHMRVSLETKQLVSEQQFADTISSSVHDQGKRELGNSCRPKAACVGPLRFLSGQTIAFCGFSVPF